MVYFLLIYSVLHFIFFLIFIYVRLSSLNFYSLFSLFRPPYPALPPPSFVPKFRPRFSILFSIIYFPSIIYPSPATLHLLSFILYFLYILHISIYIFFSSIIFHPSFGFYLPSFFLRRLPYNSFFYIPSLRPHSLSSIARLSSYILLPPYPVIRFPSVILHIKKIYIQCLHLNQYIFLQGSKQT